MSKCLVNKTNTSEKKFGSNKTLGLEGNMNGLGKLFRKNPIIKKLELIKEIEACEQKTTIETANFCSNSVFSLYFKIRVEKFRAAKYPLAF